MLTVAALTGVLLGLFAAAKAGDVDVEADDPALVYKPSQDDWPHFENPGPGQDTASSNDYYHQGGYRSTNVSGASVSLMFNGSYVAYYSDKYFTHGLMEIDLDGNKTRITTYSNLSYGTPQQKLFEAHVDPNMPNHVLILTNLENKTMGLDYLLYTAATPTNIPATSTTSSSLSTTSSSSSTTFPATSITSPSLSTSSEPSSSSTTFSATPTPSSSLSTTSSSSSTTLSAPSLTASSVSPTTSSTTTVSSATDSTSNVDPVPTTPVGTAPVPSGTAGAASSTTSETSPTETHHPTSIDTTSLPSTTTQSDPNSASTPTLMSTDTTLSHASSTSPSLTASSSTSLSSPSASPTSSLTLPPTSPPTVTSIPSTTLTGGGPLPPPGDTSATQSLSPSPPLTTSVTVTSPTSLTGSPSPASTSQTPGTPIPVWPSASPSSAQTPNPPTSLSGAPPPLALPSQDSSVTRQVVPPSATSSQALQQPVAQGPTSNSAQSRSTTADPAGQPSFLSSGPTPSRTGVSGTASPLSSDDLPTCTAPPPLSTTTVIIISVSTTLAVVVAATLAVVWIRYRLRPRKAIAIDATREDAEVGESVVETAGERVAAITTQLARSVSLQRRSPRADPAAVPLLGP